MQGNSLRCACFPTFHSMADDVDDSFAGPACVVAVSVEEMRPWAVSMKQQQL